MPLTNLRVWHGTLDVDPCVVRHLTATLSDDEGARAARFYFERDRRRYQVARGTLRSILGSLLSVDPERVRFRYGDHGKPFLAPELASDIFFNVAHSGEHLMIAVADGAEVGVDIEAIHPLIDPMAIADRFFAPPERAALHLLTPGERLTAFFQCWTRKEAFLEAIGSGLAHPLGAFAVSMGGRGQRPFEISEQGVVSTQWSLHDVSDLPQYAAAVVVGGCPARVLVEPVPPPVS